MTYHKGDLELEKDGVPSDAREDNGYSDDYRFRNEPALILPHSCDEWVIGGKEEAETLIADLQEALTRFPRKNLSPL